MRGERSGDTEASTFKPLASPSPHPSRYARHPLPTGEGIVASAYFLGLTNRSVIRSDSPIARYFALSSSPIVSVGGSVHTPLG